MKRLISVFCLLIILSSCKKDKPDSINTLTVSSNQVAFGEQGGSIDIAIQTNAGSWNISNPATEWLNLSATSGAGSNTSVTITVSSKTLTARTATLVLTAGDAQPVQITVSQAASGHLYAVEADFSNISFDKTGGSKSLKITTDAVKWELSAGTADWLQFSQTTGNTGITTITVTALANAGSARTGTISLAATNAATVQISVSQDGTLYPSYNTSALPADATGMSSTASQIAAKIKLGWNIGNSLEATGSETAWGNPRVTRELIQLVKQSGFNAIRIPCSWNQYMENTATAKIKADWLNRVKEVVQYCVDNDMYVLLNIHWDGGWLENNVTPEKQFANNAKQKAFWEQIATHLRNFDEHLLLASANEPNVENASQMAVLQSYHQTFVDAVRSTGGRNSHRVLVVQGPSTDVEKTNTLMSTLPTDQIQNKMMVEVHYYTPYQFALMTEDAGWGKMFYYWGKNFHSTTDIQRNSTWGEESTVDAMMGLMKAKFVDKGIPVILGEYAVGRRTSLTGSNLTLHLASRAYYLKYVTQQAKANGIIPFYWDAGGIGNNGSGLFDRSKNMVFDQQALDALIDGAK
ncbi:cellulase family glycosylhydrolase [Paradesertivirga mongoliensis]|uniref:Cellulase family glycosylhydrolase n=1 Tax=Paradesertivirga mongoliensis TaxID=2100740 RepID=A0ABW4ZI61_9SPHI|nr:cellulase family glycosylhydrolase [Pedobacter mongoliensis]